MNQSTQIGFIYPIKRAWLDFTAQHLLKGHSSTEIKTALDEFLSDQISVNSTAPRKTRQRVINVLLKIWVNVPPERKSFRDEGLALLKRIPNNQHLAIHWGMIMAIYPFFAIVAENVGRLLRLQQYVSITQLQKRMREKMGERETIFTATRKIIRCWAGWGVLIDTNKKEIYVVTERCTITDAQLMTWLLESALISSQGQSAVLHNLMNYTPALFPFNLSSTYFIPNERLETFSQGVSEISIAFK